MRRRQQIALELERVDGRLIRVGQHEYSGCLTNGWRHVSDHVHDIRQRIAHLAWRERVLLRDGIDGLTDSNEADDGGDVDASASDARLPEADVGIHRDSWKDFHQRSVRSFARESSRVRAYHGRKFMTAHISIERDVLAAFCRRRHISRLAVFGSVTRDAFRPDSDVDVLVEFDDGHVPSLDFMTIERELSELVGHDVDLITPKFLIARIREQVLSSIQVLYAST
jgi:predicted nucleotidyltransferase